MNEGIIEWMNEWMNGCMNVSMNGWSERSEWEGMQRLAQAWVKQLLAQILVVVANIELRTLKTEVEKGSM